MMKILRSTILVCVIAVTGEAHTQTLSDLDVLSDVVWSISLNHPDNEQAFANAVPENLKLVTIDDKTDQLIPKTWAGNAKHIVISISKYSKLDSINCTYINAAGISQFQDIIEEHGTYPIAHIPAFLNVFLFGLSKAILAEDLFRIQKCTGLFHLDDDDVNYDAWDEWYDLLEAKFRNFGMKVIRKSSTPENYVAGSLAGIGEVCEGKACIYAVAPNNRKISILNKNVVTISTTSFIRR